MPTFHSGKGAKAFVGTSTASVELPILGYSVEPSMELARFRNSKTGNFTVKEQTWPDCRFNITLDYDFAANPYLAANGDMSLFTSGTVAARLYLNGTSSAYFDFPQAVLVGNPLNVAIEGKIGVHLNLENSGPWTEPAT